MKRQIVRSLDEGLLTKVFAHMHSTIVTQELTHPAKLQLRPGEPAHVHA